MSQSTAGPIRVWDAHLNDDRVSLRWNGWKFAVLAASMSVVACMFCSFVLPALLGAHEWEASSDAWWTVIGAQWVSHGAVGTIYQGDPMFLPLPGLLILLAPIVALGDHLGLVTSFPIGLAYPSMWLLIGPVFFVIGSTSVLGADYLAESLGISRTRRRLMALSVGLLVVVPTCVRAGHPEDLLALGLCCWSLGMLLRGAPLAAAGTLAIAVMMQPWAGLLIPVLGAAAPVGRRLRFLVWSAALPASCAALLLALDPSNAIRSLIKQPMLGNGQKLPWWNLAGHMSIPVGPYLVPARVGSMSRSLAVVVALTAAAWVLRSRRPSTVMAASSVALLARGAFESQFWAWYVAPAAVVMALGVAAGARHSGRRWATGAVGSLVVYGFAGGSYSWNFSLNPWLALAILVGAGFVAIAASLPRTVTQAGEESPADFHAADLELAETLDSLEGATNYASWILEQMGPHLGSKLLEVGAGHGTFTALLARDDRRVMAVDLSRRCAQKLQDRFEGNNGVRVAQGDLSVAAGDGPFDTVVMINVLEHVEDDRAILDELWALLRPGGRLVLWVPALPALYSDFDRRVGHFRRYRLADLRSTLGTAGFKTEDVRYANAIGAVGWWVSARILHSNPTVGRGVRYFDSLLVPLIRRLESWCTPPFGQSILAVAVRP